MPDSTSDSIQTDSLTWRSLLDRLGVALEQQRQLLKTNHTLDLLPGNTTLIRLYLRLYQSLLTLDQELSAHRAELSQLRRLQTISQAMSSSLDIAELLNLVMDSIVILLRAERALLMLLDENTGKLEVQVARNINQESIEQTTFDISRSIVVSVFQTGIPVVTTNARSDPRFTEYESIIHYNLRSILCVPLHSKGVTFGVIYADSRAVSNIFVEADRNLLAAFANQAASVIENARLFRQIRDQLANITELKYLMDDVFESIASGVITIDLHDQISMYNRAAARMLGIDPHAAAPLNYQTAFKDLSRVVEVMVQQVKR